MRQASAVSRRILFLSFERKSKLFEGWSGLPPASVTRAIRGVYTRISQYHINAKTDPYREANFTGNVNFLNFSSGETHATGACVFFDTRSAPLPLMNCLRLRLRRTVSGPRTNYTPLCFRAGDATFEIRRDEKVRRFPRSFCASVRSRLTNFRSPSAFLRRSSSLCWAVKKRELNEIFHFNYFSL